MPREPLADQRARGEGAGPEELDGGVSVHEPLFLVAFWDGEERVLGFHPCRECAWLLDGGGSRLEFVLLGVGGDDVFGRSVRRKIRGFNEN